MPGYGFSLTGIMCLVTDFLSQPWCACLRASSRRPGETGLHGSVSGLAKGVSGLAKGVSGLAKGLLKRRASSCLSV